MFTCFLLFNLLTHPHLEFTMANLTCWNLQILTQLPDPISLQGKVNDFFLTATCFFLPICLYQIHNFSSTAQPVQLICTEPNLIWASILSLSDLQHCVSFPSDQHITPRSDHMKRNCQILLSEHLIKSLPPSYPSVISFLISWRNQVAATAFKELLPPLLASPAESLLPPHPLALSTVAPLKSPHWLLHFFAALEASLLQSCRITALTVILFWYIHCFENTCKSPTANPCSTSSEDFPESSCYTEVNKTGKNEVLQCVRALYSPCSSLTVMRTDL